MMRHRYERIQNYCTEKQLMQPGDGIVVGLSGGADSVYLLLFLVWLREKWDLELCAVHINHGIRGEAAKEDEIFSEKIADSCHVPFRSFREDIPALARRRKLSVEEAGREYRYQCFRQVKEELGYQRIAVAHHRDDQAETVLMQMLRGSGVRGIGGIRPANGDLIRPLLCLSRQEIEKDLMREGIQWCEDETNQGTVYDRNKVRHEVIPYLQREIQPEAVEHLAAAAEQLQDVWSYLERQIQLACQSIIHKERIPVEGEGYRLYFRRSDFLALDAVLQPYVLLEVLAEAAGSRKDLGRVHVRGLQKLIDGETGKRISLPYGLWAGRDYDQIWICPERGKGISKETETLPVRGKCCRRGILPEGIPKNNCTKWFDYAKIKSALTWRHPRNGDFLWIDEAGHRKKISRLLIDAKMSREQRATLWLLAERDHVLWIPALNRISAAYYVTKETKEVFVVQLYQTETEEEISYRMEGWRKVENHEGSDS